MHRLDRLKTTENNPTPDPGRLISDFARWAVAETDAETVGEAIAHAHSHESPLEAWRNSASATLQDGISEVDQVVAGWRAGLNAHGTRVFDERISRLSASSTLEEIGRDLGISRQGVQDMERRVVSRLDKFVHSEKGSPIRWRIEAIRYQLGTACPVDRVSSIIEDRGAASNYFELLLKLAGPYVQRHDWLVLRSSLSSDPMDEILASADEFSCIDPEFALDRLREWGLHDAFHRDWLTRDGVIRYINDQYVRWNTNVGDKLAFALFDIGRPCRLDELIAHIGWQGARGTCQNAARNDRRIIRSSPSQYSLRSWNIGSYSSIAAAIRGVLIDAEGPVHMSDLVRRIANDKDIKESSVRSYCSAPMFVQQDGWVRLRSNNEPFEYSSVTFYDTKGIFYLGSSRVTLLFEVDKDILRGSSRTISYACGKILGVEIGDNLEFGSNCGSIIRVTFRASSNSGPYMGSIRKIVEQRGAKLGDWVSIVFDRSDMTANIRCTDISDFEPSWELVGRLTGIDPEQGSSKLAMALGCDTSDIRSTLLKRNDDVVANALPIAAKVGIQRGGAAGAG